MSKLIKIILESENIILARHEFPDFDALGSQFGLFYWIKENFPTKKIYCLGTNVPNKFPDLFSEQKDISDEVFSNSLIIICDVRATDRVDDQRYKNSNNIFVIDHHIKKDEKTFEHDSIIIESASSTCEIIAQELLSVIDKYKLPIKSINSLFLGIVTDTGRFLYSNTNKNTYEVVLKFKELGLQEKPLYDKLTVSNLTSRKFSSQIINNMKITKKGVGYYILNPKVLKKSKMEYSEAKDYVFAMAGIEEVKIWAFCSYDIDKKQYRISLRSRNYNVNKIAAKYGGGGHMYASGCKVDKLSIFKKIINDLNLLIE
ncbi:hypothetical protein ASO20_02275 [Mycoplasma sp. (ex Biomphalaria glabrata)]|uniref:DHH family phosphoesterase n=1 Tax=Mycoplasma sp. (ex Biomphalaria glabrata) TaxID=1749074 RepID=UPI00073ABA06|nr:bifunctional oligoribonuclease/PAP phosphatase NrnA [Mycoplasma sp. (ex Biomphalaria glabrata)]ALV23463.1 hypothetical protein ASO20_02275 [Mycoplasma sp. (ex Biomphalaria glabrata)]